MAIAGLVYPADEDFPTSTFHTVYFMTKSRVAVIDGWPHKDPTPTPWFFEDDDKNAEISEHGSDDDDAGDPPFDARSEVTVCRQEIAMLKEALSLVQGQLHNIVAQAHVQGPALSPAQLVLQSVHAGLLFELGKPPRQEVRKSRKRNQTDAERSSLTCGTLLRAFVAIKVPCSYKTFQEILTEGAAHGNTSRTPPVSYIPSYPRTTRPLRPTMSYHVVFLTFYQLCSYIGITNEVTRSEMLVSSHKKGGIRILGTAAEVKHRWESLKPDVHLTPGISSQFVQEYNVNDVDATVTYAPSLLNEQADYIVEREAFREPFCQGARRIPKKMSDAVESLDFQYGHFYLTWSGVPSPQPRFDSDIPFSVDPQGTLRVSMPAVGTTESQKERISTLLTDRFVRAVVSNK